MSVYQQGLPQGGGGGFGQGQNQLPGTAPALSLLGQNDMMGGSLDLDMSLPMDLDLDLNTGALGQAPYSNPGLGMVNAVSSTTPNANILGLATGSADNGYGEAQQQDHQPEQQQEEDTPMTGPGAGPLPATHGMQQTGQSTLTEFTKRRNWSQRIIEELRDFLHILTPDGRILYVSPSCRSITGYEPQQIIGKFIGEFVHPDDTGIFMREFNESIASGNPLRFFYRFKKEEGIHVIFECHGHPHISPAAENDPQSTFGKTPAQVQNTKMAGVCKGFFMMARPYPTKNAALLDSFLEHKIENERLLKRIDELKREELEETAEQDRLYLEHSSETPRQSDGGKKSQKVHGDASPHDAPKESTPNYEGMPPPAKPTISNTALTRQNLSEALSGQRTEGIADKMSRYESSSTHLESIEMITGLRYSDGERSHGISTGDTSPALIRGDAGIAILVDRERERDSSSKKEKKKLKVADEYVCTDCGTLDSPEWRKGPKGPKTLCNACGLRWAKKEKKRSGPDDGKDQSPMGANGGQAPPGLPKHNSGGSD